MQERWKLNKKNELRDRLSRYLLDMRQSRVGNLLNKHDLLTDRDSFIALRYEMAGFRKEHLTPTKYYGIILPEEASRLINLERVRTYCPNCVNSVYTNLWVYDEERFNDNQFWQNLFILSPNQTYDESLAKLIDCG